MSLSQKQLICCFFLKLLSAYRVSAQSVLEWLLKMGPCHHSNTQPERQQNLSLNGNTQAACIAMAAAAGAAAYVMQSAQRDWLLLSAPAVPCCAVAAKSTMQQLYRASLSVFQATVQSFETKLTTGQTLSRGNVASFTAALIDSYTAYIEPPSARACDHTRLQQRVRVLCCRCNLTGAM